MSHPEDRTPLDEARRGMAGRYVALAHRFARVEGRGRPDRQDEFMREAEYAVVKAAQLWAGEFGPAFGPHVVACIRRRLLDHRRARAARKRRPMAEVPAGLADPRPGPADLAGARLDAADLLGRLPPRERLAVELTVMAGLTLAEASARIGITRQNVHHARRRGLERLRVEAQAAETAEA